MYPLISVIVPVYNVEKYLKQCLDSIINQTYKNLQIILIDDGQSSVIHEEKNSCNQNAVDNQLVSLLDKE